MFLADRKYDGLAHFAADGVPQRVLQECLAEELVGRVGKEALLKFTLFVGLFLLFSLVVRKGNDESLFREQFGRHLCACIHNRRVDQIAVLNAVEQGVLERGLSAFTPEGAVGVQEQAAFGFARVPRVRTRFVESLEIVPGGRGQAQLVPHEIVEYGPGISADGPVRFVRDDEVEVGRGEESLILVVEQQRLDRGDDDFRRAPVVAPLFVHHRLEVRREQGGEDLASLLLEFQPVHEKQDSGCVARAHKELDDRCGDERLARTRGHFEQKPVSAVSHRPLQSMNGPELVGAE